MTITAGNSNNGIPMGGYVPGTGSGGGGGVSGDVYRYKGSVPTYTALPAENLETGDVYNVIDTDMNYAWTGTAWDPLGSTVDLSPYYTGAQVDVKLAKKQDKLTPNAPLKISSYAKVYGFVGMVSDGAGGYYTDKHNEYYVNTSRQTWEVRFEWNSTGATETTKSHYIDLPFEIGKIYKVPGMKGVNNSFINGVIVGYTPEDNTTFHPSFKVGLSDGIIDIVGSTSMTPAIKSEDNWYTFYTRATGVPSTNYNGGTDERMYWSTKDAIEAMPSPENIDPTVAYFQILDEGTYLQMNVLGARYDDGEWLYQRKSFGASHSLMLTKVRQMNTVRIYAALGMYSSGYGSSAENPMLSSQLGIYPTESNLFTMTSEELLALPNEFVIGNESIKTYLDLDIGAGLTVSDNVLINSNPTPYELPTASTETLGGVKVDGTSIVIADGVISTNTGTGVDTYTKVEVNNLLSTKQDTITPSSPLSITKEVRSNLQGFQYTTDSTGVYTTGNYYWSSWVAPYQFIKANGDLPGTTLNPQTFTNKIIIPYTFGQVVKLPTDSTLGTPNGGYSPFCFGKILNDGTFIPIYQPILNSRYIIMSDTPTTYGGTNNKLIRMPTTDTGKQSPDTYEQLASDADNLTYVLIQMLLDDTDSNLSTNVMNYSPYSTSQGHPGKGQYNFTQANYINRLKEINCIIICPTPGYGINTDTAISVSSIGLYANPGNLYNLITSENYNNIDLGENLFDLSGEQAYNYLDLNIDNSTIKVNDSGQLYAESTAPSNMMTTDTTQTITGAKTFNAETTGFHHTNMDTLNIQSRKALTYAGLGSPIGDRLTLGGDNQKLAFTSNSDIYVNNNTGNAPAYVLTTRNFANKVVAGEGVNITSAPDSDNLSVMYTISATASGGGGSYTLPAATADTLGGIKVGSNLAVTDDGTLSATYIPATTTSLGSVKPDGTTVTIDEDGTIHSTQEGFADLAANNVFTGTNQFQNTVTVGNGFNTAVLNMGPGSGLIFENSSQAGGKKLSLGTQTGTQVTIYSDGVPIIQRSETRTNQSSSDDNPYTKYNNVDSGNINDILGVSFWKGTQTEYDGITEKDANTLYIITG